MGSDSDWDTVKPAAEILDHFGVGYEVAVVSAHRTPDRMLDYARTAHTRGRHTRQVGGTAGAGDDDFEAAATPLPVIGIPRALKDLDGLDSLLSIVQMPSGVPTATVSIGGAKNAGLLAVRILGVGDPALTDAMAAYQADMAAEVEEKDRRLRERLS